MGEDGFDIGGLRREYFTLAFKEFSFKYLEGRSCFQHNAVAYQVIAVDYVLVVCAHAALSIGLYSHCIILQGGVYKQLGMLAAMCLVHGGAPIKVFTTSVYKVMCGANPADIVDIDEVSDAEIQTLLKEV